MISFQKGKMELHRVVPRSKHKSLQPVLGANLCHMTIALVVTLLPDIFWSCLTGGLAGTTLNQEYVSLTCSNFGLSGVLNGRGKKAMECSKHLSEKSNHGQQTVTIACYYCMPYIWEMRLNYVGKLVG